MIFQIAREGLPQSATTAIDFPQREIVNINTFQCPNIDCSVLAEEVWIAALPADGRATGWAERMDDALLAELVLFHVVFAGNPLDVGLERVHHKVAVDMADRAWCMSEWERISRGRW